MELRMLWVSGYRSVRDVRLKLGRLNVLVGGNGSGKTNLYRALGLLPAGASGQFARTLVDEGGMPSVLWAGSRTKGPVRMTVGVRLDEFAWETTCGLMPVIPGGSAFDLDPHIKEESLLFYQGARKTELLKRQNATIHARDDQGTRVTFPFVLPESESVLSELREPQRFPILFEVRQELLSWRFYHQFRTDASSPIRHPRIGTRTTSLAADGGDLAAALQTIREIGDAPALGQAIRNVFPGAELIIEHPQARFSFALQMPEFPRPFAAHELSDGTLQYLCLIGALLSPRPAPLLAFNEPETSIHPDWLLPLAHLLVRAARTSQLWITTHSVTLAEHLQRLGKREGRDVALIRLEKPKGETRVKVADDDDEEIFDKHDNENTNTEHGDFSDAERME